MRVFDALSRTYLRTVLRAAAETGAMAFIDSLFVEYFEFHNLLLIEH